MLTLSHTFQIFLAQPTFAARTRESYAEDLAPLMRTLGEAPISTLTSQVATDFLATQEHLAASTYNRRFAALPGSHAILKSLRISFATSFFLSQTGTPDLWMRLTEHKKAQPSHKQWLPQP